MGPEAVDWVGDKAEFVEQAHNPDGSVADLESSLLVSEFTRLTQTLLAASSVAEALELVVLTAHRIVPGAELVSVTLRSPDGAFHTPVATDSVAIELDQVQYQTGEGPCVDAARPSGPAYACSDNLAAEPAWPQFGRAAAAHGFASVLATALLLDALPPQLSGALNIYARAALGADARDHALLLATHASLALARTQAVTHAELREAQLRKAIDSRDVIGQAKGVLMHRRGINADEAFDLLRRTSQDLNIKLAELANTLATRHSELD